MPTGGTFTENTGESGSLFSLLPGWWSQCKEDLFPGANSRHGTTSVDHLSEIEDDRVNKILLRPLEQFICGTEDVDSVWQRLREADAPPDVCGKVFKSGETCYNCK